MAKSGDVFSINTKKGISYFQCLGNIPRFSYIIRVFSGFFSKEEKDLEKIVTLPVSFIIFFPLGSAERRKTVHKCGHVALDEESKKMPIFRNGVPNPKTNKVEVWCFWDGEKEWIVENITDEQRKYPIKMIANNASLIHKIETGWTPENHPW